MSSASDSFLNLIVITSLLGLIPILVVTATCFLKISAVIMLVRNALGVQQVPPNMAIYTLSLVLSLYVMNPTIIQAGESLDKIVKKEGIVKDLAFYISTVGEVVEPFRIFLKKHAKPQQVKFFMDTAKRVWPPDQAQKVKETDFVILLPAFVIGELQAAFEIGFLLYLPFIVIDLIVSNILLALGMMMMSPVTISLPLKLFLFVSIDGWTKLIHGLILSYAT